MKKRYFILVMILELIFFCHFVYSQTQDVFEEAIKNISSTDPFIRRQAAEQLGTSRNSKAIPYLKRLLKDENPFVRQAAVDSLGFLRAKECVQDLVNLLKTEKDPQVRQSIIVAFGYIGSLEPLNILIEILKNPKETLSVKYAVCNTLGILRSTATIEVLSSLLKDENIDLRRSAAYALGKIPHPDSYRYLREIIEENLTNENILIDVIYILTEANDKESVEKFKIVYSTNITTQKAKFYAACGLAKIEKDISVLPLIKKSLNSNDENIKNYAIDAIRVIGDKESLNILKDMLTRETSPYTKMLLEIAIKQLEVKYPQTKSIKR